MIRVEGLTKHFGSKTALGSVTFDVQPGRVTGFVGPNGAGKTTAMRIMVGLERATAGSATVNGMPYARHRMPFREAGVLLDAKSMHPGRTAYDHLRALAATHGIPVTRVRDVISIAGLDNIVSRRVNALSLGKAHRLGVAAALLGDPQTLIFDEPFNGLDAEGLTWLRDITRTLAADGRTVFLSSHLVAELETTADHLIVIRDGRLLADLSVSTLLGGIAHRSVRVRSPRLGLLRSLVTRPGVAFSVIEPGVAEITGLAADHIAAAAAAAGIAIHELTPQLGSLTAAYAELIRNATDEPATAA